MGLLSKFAHGSNNEPPRVARRDNAGVAALRARSAQRAKDAFENGDIEDRLQAAQRSSDRETSFVVRMLD